MKIKPEELPENVIIVDNDIESQNSCITKYYYMIFNEDHDILEGSNCCEEKCYQWSVSSNALPIMAIFITISLIIIVPAVLTSTNN